MTTSTKKRANLYYRDGRECMKLIYSSPGGEFEEARDYFVAAVKAIDRLRASWIGEDLSGTGPSVDFSTVEAFEASFCAMQEKARTGFFGIGPKVGCDFDGTRFTYETGTGSAFIEFARILDDGEDGQLWEVSGYVYVVNPSSLMRKVRSTGIRCWIERETTKAGRKREHAGALSN